jgi:NADH dehydrogenase
MVAAVNAWFFDMWAAVALGLFANRIFTRDQVRLLRQDDVVGEGARTLSDLGVEATPMEAILESYLYCHRANGQYTAIKESAKNIKA